MFYFEYLKRLMDGPLIRPNSFGEHTAIVGVSVVPISGGNESDLPCRLLNVTDVVEKRNAFVLRVVTSFLSCLNWRHHASPKRRYLYDSKHYITSYPAVIRWPSLKSPLLMFLCFGKRIANINEAFINHFACSE
jgi:hypothetical protein